MTSADEPTATAYTPLYAAEHATRFERQRLIRDYEASHNCSLIVVKDAIFPDSVAYFEELVFDLDHDKDLHLMLGSPGGDGETAIRLIRSSQARCREFVVVIPDQAKSAATLLALGAHRLLMGPPSDLGPVDPQFPIGKGLVAAKDIIAAVEDASRRLQEAPETYPLWASLLADVTGIMVQQARSATGRSEDLLGEALGSVPNRSPDDITTMKAKLKERLIDSPRSHEAVFSAREAKEAGLPVEELDPRGDHWRLIWRIWTNYIALGNDSVYEGRRASRIIERL